jgi:hypothetical protein
MRGALPRGSSNIQYNLLLPLPLTIKLQHCVLCRCSTAFVSALLKRRQILAPQRRVTIFSGEVGRSKDGKVWECACMTAYTHCSQCPLHKPSSRHTLHAQCSRYLVAVLCKEQFCCVMPEFPAFAQVFNATWCSTSCQVSRSSSGQYCCRQQHRLDVLGVTPSGIRFVVEIQDKGHNSRERRHRDARVQQWCMENRVPRLCIPLRQGATVINHTVVKQTLSEFISGEVQHSGYR